MGALKLNPPSERLLRDLDQHVRAWGWAIATGGAAHAGHGEKYARLMDAMRARLARLETGSRKKKPRHKR